MSSWPARIASMLLLSAVAQADDVAPASHSQEDTAPDAMTDEDAALVGVGTASVPIGYVNKKDPWIDRVHNGVFNAVWRSAMASSRPFC